MIIQDLTDDECALLCILSDETGIDFAEFFFEDPISETKAYRLYDYQWSLYADEATQQVTRGARNTGKALAVDTPIPTPDGWTTMGGLVAGDRVFDDQGNITTVLEAFDIMHGRPCFEMEFSDGTRIVADAEHPWVTTTKQDRRRGRVASVRTTREISESVKYGREANHSVVAAGALASASPAELTVPPYTLGAWLGDGSSLGGTITTMDQEILANCAMEGVRATEVPSGCGRSRAGFYRLELSHVERATRSRGLSVELALLGIRTPYGSRGSRKRIPATYLRASESVRRSVLAGIMDTDGTIDKRWGRVEITLCNEGLACDVLELARSLGQVPSWSKGVATLDGVEVGPKYRVGWQPTEDPFRIGRKSRYFRARQRRNQRSIRRVSAVASVPVRCIRVAAESHLFLAGESMIPTHNSAGVQGRTCTWPFRAPGRDYLLTAPQQNHLAPLVMHVEERIKNTWITAQMLPQSGKSDGFRKAPQWECTFVNGAKIISRLPGQAPNYRGVKGMHADEIEVDEIQDYPDGAMTQLRECLNVVKGAKFRVHGVPTGMRGFFYNVTEGAASREWSVHRPIAMNRPNWSDEERQNKIGFYGGSRRSQGYRCNLYGSHGDASTALFVLARLIDATDLDLESVYNTTVYTRQELDYDVLGEETPAVAALQLNGMHLTTWELAPKGYSAFYGGIDVGATTDPSELLVFGQRAGVQREQVDLLMRLTMHRIPISDQEAVIRRLFDWMGKRLVSFGIDKTGLGFDIAQRLESAHPGRAIGYNFSEKVVVGISDRELTEGEVPEDLHIKRNAVDQASDWLREMVDAKAIMLPNDNELITQWQGQQVVTTGRSATDPYGRRSYVGGKSHSLDAAKVMIAAKRLLPLQALLNPPQEAVLDYFPGSDESNFVSGLTF